MTPKDEKGEEGEDHLSWPGKQRLDSGFAPLSPDEENGHAEPFSSVKTRHTNHVPSNAGGSIAPPLLSSKDFHDRAEDGFAFTEVSNMQDHVLNNMLPMTSLNRFVIGRVSRFEDVFKKMRKKDQAALGVSPDPNQKAPSKFATFDSWVNDKASDFTKQACQSEQAATSSDTTTVWSSSKNLHSRRSSGTSSNASFKATFTAAKSNQTPTRKQEIMQMTSWRGSPKAPEKGVFADISMINRVPSPIETIFTRAQAIEAAVQAKQVAIEKHFGPGTLRAFYPSNRALERNHTLPGRDVSRASTSSTRSSSPAAYLGDLSLENNRSADIPEHENCALWIWGLPGRVTYDVLLGSIRGVGKVYATVINPPNDSIRTSAAKIIFFNRNQAEKLFNMIKDRQFVVLGKVVHKVVWNKIRTGPYPHSSHSRVIRITGPRELMDFEYFENFFVHRFQYDLDVRGVMECNRPGLVSHVWHFGSLRCQAASAKTAIERELKGIYEVEWADDPCESP